MENIVNEEEQIRDNKFFLDILFSFNIIENNLTYLKISFINNCAIKTNTFEKINNFKLLRYLYIENFTFDINFEIKLINIISLSCIRCKNISLSGNLNSKIEILYSLMSGPSLFSSPKFFGK